jgi:hypothetical protein
MVSESRLEGHFLPAPDTEKRAVLDRLLALAQEHDDGPGSLEEMIASRSE